MDTPLCLGDAEDSAPLRVALAKIQNTAHTWPRLLRPAAGCEGARVSTPPPSLLFFAVLGTEPGSPRPLSQTYFLLRQF